MMLHTKHQGYRPYGFRQEDFCMFFPIESMLNMCPLGQDLLWPQRDNLNKFGRGLLGDVTYQISKL